MITAGDAIGLAIINKLPSEKDRTSKVFMEEFMPEFLASSEKLLAERGGQYFVGNMVSINIVELYPHEICPSELFLTNWKISLHLSHES